MRYCLEDLDFRWHCYDIHLLELFPLLLSIGHRHIGAEPIPELNVSCWGIA
jgi:hypothetical protein